MTEELMGELYKKDNQNCGPECAPDCGPDCSPECADGHCAPADNSARDSTLVKTADNLVLMMFVVGAYAQIFSLFLYIFH